MRDIIPFSSAPATAGQPSMSGWRLLSTDQQCDTLVEGSRGTAGDVSAGPVQACSLAAGAAATGVASSGDAGGSPGAALQGEEVWRLVPTAGAEGLRRWAADRARCLTRGRDYVTRVAVSVRVIGRDWSVTCLLVDSGIGIC